LLNFLIAKNEKKLHCPNRILTQSAGLDTFSLVVVQFVMTLFASGCNVAFSEGNVAFSGGNEAFSGGSADFSGSIDKQAVLNFHGPPEMAAVLALHQCHFPH
jgi:hypothetical protein